MKFELNAAHNIKFTDTTGITYDMWLKIHNKFNYLGYALPDVEFTKNYVSRGYFLQPDQSKAVLQILKHEHEEELYSKDQINADIANAKQIFGLTNDFNKAGYLLPDGAMLNFCYDEKYNWQRDRDHREIAEALSEITDDSYSGALIQFMNYGAIRVLPCGLEMAQKPTEAQRRKIAEFLLMHRDGFLEISNHSGHVIKSIDAQYLPATAIRAMDEYFEQIEQIA